MYIYIYIINLHNILQFCMPTQVLSLPTASTALAPGGVSQHSQLSGGVFAEPLVPLQAFNGRLGRPGDRESPTEETETRNGPEMCWTEEIQ